MGPSMDLRLLAVGKLRPAYRDAADDYLKRLAALRDGIRDRDQGSLPRPDRCGAAEGGGWRALRAKSSREPGSVALDREGTYLTSEALAHQLSAGASRPAHSPF